MFEEHQAEQCRIAHSFLAIMFNFLSHLTTLHARKKRNKVLSKPARSLKEFRKNYPKYTIGSNCYGTPNIKFQHPNAYLHIGSYCSIAKNVQIFMGGMHRTNWVSTYPFHAFFDEGSHIQNGEITNGDVIIGSDVWLCQDATILSGVTIGHGAVVANGAIVTKDVAPYSIVGGNPAKHIRWRFDEATRNALLNIAWWDWQEEEVLSVVDLICSDNITLFLEYANNRVLKTTSTNKCEKPTE